MHSSLFERRRALPTVACVATLWWCAVGAAHASTVVRFNSALGSFLVRLYDQRTPLTTNNFVAYSNAGDWKDTFIHRSMPGFVVQGGGFTFRSNVAGIQTVTARDAVLNEPVIANLRGAIVMAKMDGDPNSATHDWFFNLANNVGTEPLGLNFQNGGFTPFGAVLGSGMDVVDAIAAVPRVNFGGALTSLPLRNYAGNGVVKDNFVTFSSIAKVDVHSGDYNFDGKVGSADLARWKTGFASEANIETLVGGWQGDFDLDGLVESDDLLKWQRELGSRYFAADLATWMEHLGQTVSHPTLTSLAQVNADADDDGDARVDGADLLAWQRALGGSFTPPLEEAAATSVPEPAAATLALCAALVVASRRRSIR